MQQLTCDRCSKTGFSGPGQLASHQRWCNTQRSADAFWAKVDKNGPNGCWLYTGFRKWDGYGWLQRAGKFMTAHRYAWILAHGEPAAGLHILHECDNPPCCNPSHLKLGTHQENMDDRSDKGRHHNGRTHKPVLHPNRIRPERKETA